MIYYKDFDISPYYNDLNITKKEEKHIFKFKLFINELLKHDDNEMYIGLEQLYSIFGHSYFKSIKKEIEENTWVDKLFRFNVKLNSINGSEADERYYAFILFHRLFKRIELGNNKKGTFNKYKLRINQTNINEFKSILNDNQIAYSQFDDTKSKVTSLKKQKRYYSHHLKINRKHVMTFIEKNELQYGLDTTNDFLTLKGLTNYQIDKIKRDFQTLKGICDNLPRNNQLLAEYEVKDSGRMYTSLGNNIQGMTKTIRNELLYGYFENDISSAAPSYFIQVFKHLISDSNLNILDDYINSDKCQKKENKDHITKRLFNLSTGIKISIIEDYTQSPQKKKEIRKKLALIIKGNEDLEDQFYIDKAKEILTMIFFGAETKNKQTLELEEAVFTDDGVFMDEFENIEYYKTSIQNTLTKEQRNRFFNSELVQEFLFDAELIMDVISFYLHKFYYKNKSLKINNRLLKFNKRYSKSKALAFMYQSWESTALRVMEQTYKQNTKDRNYLLLHDGIYTNEKINSKLFEDAVYNEIGNVDFKIKIIID